MNSVYSIHPQLAVGTIELERLGYILFLVLSIYPLALVWVLKLEGLGVVLKGFRGI